MESVDTSHGFQPKHIKKITSDPGGQKTLPKLDLVPTVRLSLLRLPSPDSVKRENIEALVRKCTDERQSEYIRRLEYLEQHFRGNHVPSHDQNIEFDPELFTPRTKLKNAKEVSLPVAELLTPLAHYTS